MVVNAVTIYSFSTCSNVGVLTTLVVKASNNTYGTLVKDDERVRQRTVRDGMDSYGTFLLHTMQNCKSTMI